MYLTLMIGVDASVIKSKSKFQFKLNFYLIKDHSYCKLHMVFSLINMMGF